MRRYSRITGTGSFLPPKRLSNAELAAQLAKNGIETSDEWIVERTGIHERRWYTPGVDTVTNMSVKASQMAMERAGVDPKEIEFIVFATVTSDYFLPGNEDQLNSAFSFTANVTF